MMIDDINNLPAEIGEHDTREIERFREFLRTRKALRAAVQKHGVDSPEASRLRFEVLKMVQGAREAPDEMASAHPA